MNNTLCKKQVINVLIVEDYKLTRVGLKSALNEFDFIDVNQEAQDAIEALDIIPKTNPDVVLMDVGLPGMNGFEAAMKIREMNVNSKVIILTSHERREDVITAMGSGVYAYCLKDISPDDLARVIVEVAKGACYIDPVAAKYVIDFFPKPENISLVQSLKAEDARAQLTDRELEVLKHLVNGKSNTEIAKELIVSVHTAKAHVCSILQKLCVNDRVQAAVKAIRENIV